MAIESQKDVQMASYVQYGIHTETLQNSFIIFIYIFYLVLMDTVIVVTEFYCDGAMVS